MTYYTNVRCIGSTLYYRGVRDGQHIKERREYSPVLFLPSTNQHSEFRTLEGTPVEPKFFDKIRDARNFLNQYKDVTGFTIYGQTRFEYTYISDEHPEAVIEWNVNNIVIAFLDIETGSESGFPEPRTADCPVTAITVKLSNSPNYYVWGTGVFNNTQDNIFYRHCLNERDLLENFLQFWIEAEPDVVSGWNIKSFDIPYLYRRVCKLFGESMAKRLSPFGVVLEDEEQFYQKNVITYDLVGIATLDYLQLFRKYAPNASQESYKLDHIAFVELKQKKLSFDEYETLHQLYKLNHQKFIEYNIKDVALVEQLNAKGRLIEMALTLAYDNKVNYEDVFTQVRMWDVICYNHLRAKNIVVPPGVKQDKTFYEGAYVKDPQIGLFEWIVSFDLASLYPHLIMEYNLSPETLRVIPELSSMTSAATVETLLNQTVATADLKAHRVTITPNKQTFSTEKQGFLPEIMDRMFKDRSLYKTKMLEAKKLLEALKKDTKAPPARIQQLGYEISRYNNLQLSKKVGLNSAYGAMGNNYFRFYDIRIAEAITLSGQLSIRWIERTLNQYLNQLLKTQHVDYVIAIDTDSVYLNLGPLVKKLSTPGISKDKIVSTLDQFCQEKIQPQIDRSYQNLASYVNAYAQKMQMKREAIADQAIWTAKKRYLMNVYDLEGVRFSEPQLKIQGLEAIKSSTPSACREKIKEILNLIFSGNQSAVIEFINTFRQEFKTFPAQEVSFPRSVNGLSKYRRATRISNTIASDDDLLKAKGTPIHVKGALVYNHQLIQDHLETQYETIQEGEKIKFVYLKEPNQFRSSVISFIQQPPKQWKLETMIDYDTQFEKSFVEPLKIVLDAIGWKTEETQSLEGFFA